MCALLLFSLIWLGSVRFWAFGSVIPFGSAQFHYMRPRLMSSLFWFELSLLYLTLWLLLLCIASGGSTVAIIILIILIIISNYFWIVWMYLYIFDSLANGKQAKQQQQQKKTQLAFDEVANAAAGNMKQANERTNERRTSISSNWNSSEKFIWGIEGQRGAKQRQREREVKTI